MQSSVNYTDLSHCRAEGSSDMANEDLRLEVQVSACSRQANCGRVGE